MPKKHHSEFVSWFRSSSPYIHAHRGRTFVIVFGGEVLLDEVRLEHLIHDVATLSSLGIRLVLVHGTRPQIEQRLQERGATLRYENALRVTDDEALVCVKEAAGSVRVEIEARLSMGLANTPMSGAHIRVASGNFVTARPLGVRNGIDYCHTGEVRRIDVPAIQQRLDQGAVVLISPIGYSPTGEVFNLSAEDVATAVSIQLKVDKLFFLIEEQGVMDSDNQLLQQLTPNHGELILQQANHLPEEVAIHLSSAIKACKSGVHRSHLVNRNIDGALLLELFTRDGVGTMVSAEAYETLRSASIDDVGGILELIKPLESEGILVRRSRERLEMEIDCFTVIERDGMIIGCGALHRFDQDTMAELACLAIDQDYQHEGRGDVLFEHMQNQAKRAGIQQIFVLTTRTAHWFLERGFKEIPLDKLPIGRQALYNYQRKSKIFIKNL